MEVAPRKRIEVVLIDEGKAIVRKGARFRFVSLDPRFASAKGEMREREREILVVGGKRGRNS